MRLASPVPPPAELRDQPTDEVSSTIDHLVHGMGFPLEAAQAALEMSDGVLSRAVAALLGEELGSPPSATDDARRLIEQQDREYDEMLARDRARDEQQQRSLQEAVVAEPVNDESVAEPVTEPVTAEERRRILAGAALSRLTQ